MTVVFDRAAARVLPRLHERQELEEAHNARAHPDGPFGVELTSWTSPDGRERVAVRCPQSPDKESRNQIINCEYDDLDALDALSGWFDEAGCSAHMRGSGADLRPKVAGEMYARGFLPKETEIWLAARATDMPAPDPAIAISLADTPEERDLWCDVAMRGWGFSKAEKPVNAASLAPFPGAAHWRWLIARVDGAPVGEALLVFYDDVGVAYLADAAVVPEGRGKGVQRALIAERARLAKEAGFERVFAGATFGSASHKNMLAAGLIPAEVSILWTRLPVRRAKRA